MRRRRPGRPTTPIGGVGSSERRGRGGAVPHPGGLHCNSDELVTLCPCIGNSNTPEPAGLRGGSAVGWGFPPTPIPYSAPGRVQVALRPFRLTMMVPFASSSFVTRRMSV